MNKVRWGILATGKIARKFAADLKLVVDAELVAVASRDLETAKAFAAEFPAKYVFGSYKELVACNEVDVIYIASPHSHHHEHTMLCLKQGKAVLCEKAFAINQQQAKEMIDLARSKKLFLMEALWTRFLPHYAKVREMIAEGVLGELKGVLANFGFKPPEPISPRLYQPELGGGSLLDIGIYPVFLAQSILGVPDGITAKMDPADTGVDEQCSMIFHYKNGMTAHLFSTLASNLETDADIFGTQGRIRLTNRFYEPSATIQFYPDVITSRTIIPVQKEPGWGYQYEIKHVHECMHKGLTESTIWTLDDTYKLMQTLDAVRASMGLKYSVWEPL